MQVLLLFTNFLCPPRAYLLIAELDMPIRLLAYGGAQRAHTELDEGAGRVALFGIIIVVDVVVPLADLCEWVGETVNVKTKDVVGVGLVEGHRCRCRVC